MKISINAITNNAVATLPINSIIINQIIHIAKKRKNPPKLIISNVLRNFSKKSCILINFELKKSIFH
jgi:hypothetical protein